jgi:1-acyl-sn-glycerol-3-phosphate acyltransferase
MYQETAACYTWLRNRRRRLGHIDSEAGAQAAKVWGGALLRELGVSLDVLGSPPMEEGGIFVTNHVGYIEVLVWLNATRCCFLGKSALSKMPMIGISASWLGTVWVDRTKKTSREAARDAIASAVSQGHRVVVFPEGTTSLEGLPWRRGVFEVAAEHGLTVQAAAYSLSKPSLAVWTDDPFPTNFWTLLGEPNQLQARLEFLEPMTIEDPARDALRLEKRVKDIVRRQTW